MSATHATGATSGIRQGCNSVIHSFLLQDTLSLGADRLLLKIPGSTLHPICFRVFALVVAAYANTGAATLSVGQTGAGYTDILNAVDMKAAAGTTYAPTGTNAFEMVEDDVEIHAVTTLATDDDTVGRILICVEVWDVNVVQPTQPS